MVSQEICNYSGQQEEDAEAAGATHVQANEGTGDQQDHAKVAGADVERRDHDGAANGRQRDGHDDVPAEFEPAAGRPRHDEGDQERDDGGRRLYEVGRRLVEAESSDNLMVSFKS